MIDAPTLDLTDYPEVRTLSLTAHDCDLISRALGIVLVQCQKAADAVSTDPIAGLSAAWLRDEIQRVSSKFSPKPAP